MAKQQQRLVILGGGESGVGAALLGLAKGYKVFLSDAGTLAPTYLATLQTENIPFEQGQHTPEQLINADLVVKSPGIPDTAPVVVNLRALSIPVISEIEFAARYTTAKLIGITGSNGKTTTARLLYHILHEAGLNVGLAGNVGDSFAKQVIANTFAYYVLEISSFQLDGMYDTRLDVAILLNITPDHLERYNYDFEQYVASKWRILRHMRPTDTFIYFNENQPTRQQLARHPPVPVALPLSLETPVTPGGYALNSTLTTHVGERSFSLATAGLPLLGPHNALNMLAATLAAQVMNVPDEAIVRGLQTFQNDPHRMELVAVMNQVRFINDSKATNVDSTFYALSGMDRPSIWLAGGLDKGNDYAQLDAVVRQRVKALICVGKDTAPLVTHFQGVVPIPLQTRSLTEAVALALTLAQPGETVLFSPACKSFDLFQNYQDRGNQFKQAVLSLPQP